MTFGSSRAFNLGISRKYRSLFVLTTFSSERIEYEPARTGIMEKWRYAARLRYIALVQRRDAAKWCLGKDCIGLSYEGGAIRVDKRENQSGEGEAYVGVCLSSLVVELNGKTKGQVNRLVKAALQLCYIGDAPHARWHHIHIPIPLKMPHSPPANSIHTRLAL